MSWSFSFFKLFGNSKGRSISKTDLIPIEEGWIAILPEYESKNIELTYKKNHSSQVTDRIKEVVKTYAIDCDDLVINNEDKISVFRDVFTQLSVRWIEDIKRIAINKNINWYPQQNVKNVLGGMIDIANCTCPNKLTTVGLIQCIKAVHLSLINSVADSLTQEQTMELLEIILLCLPYIIDIWIKLAK